MTKPSLTYGDMITCKISGNKIIKIMSGQADVELQFEVIGYSFDDDCYIIHIPRYYDIHNAWPIENKHLNSLFIPDKFLSQKAATISRDKIIRSFKIKTNQDGMSCYKCNKFYHLAEANQPDGALICWSCRNDPFRF